MSVEIISKSAIPVIAIDGPSASGKGTVAQLVAQQLGFHYLDSGALYRIVALAASRMDIGWQAGSQLAELATKLDIKFEHDEIYLNNELISEQIRSEEMGRGASEVAVHTQLRAALVNLQYSFRKAPGLVADGRDMASVVFTDAILKIFLTANVETRAERRYQQLIGKGLSAEDKDKHKNKYSQILADLQQRDLRDSQRSAAPLIQTPDALLLDTSNRSIDEAVEFVLLAYEAILKKMQ